MLQKTIKLNGIVSNALVNIPCNINVVLVVCVCMLLLFFFASSYVCRTVTEPKLEAKTTATNNEEEWKEETEKRNKKRVQCTLTRDLDRVHVHHSYMQTNVHRGSLSPSNQNEAKKKQTHTNRTHNSWAKQRKGERASERASEQRTRCVIQFTSTTLSYRTARSRWCFHYHFIRFIKQSFLSRPTVRTCCSWFRHFEKCNWLQQIERHTEEQDSDLS